MANKILVNNSKNRDNLPRTVLSPRYFPGVGVRPLRLLACNNEFKNEIMVLHSKNMR